MNKVSLITQKKIIWIPAINWFCLFVWVYNNWCDRYSLKKLPRELWIIFSSSLPLVFIQLIVCYIFPMIGHILYYINGYIIPLIMGIRFIKYYEALEKLDGDS